MAVPATTAADILVIFGITGDLAKTQTFRALYRMERRGELQCRVVGVARSDWSDATLRSHARQAIEDSGEKTSERVFQRLAERLSMVPGDYQDAKTYDRVAHAIAGRQNSPVFYLEIPPSLFGRVVEGLAGAGLTNGARVALEKPFGHDLASARALNAELHKFLEERQIYRVDHFLGKEPTMDIAYLRFANSVFEPLWNRDRIQSVQVTMAEDFGVADRGAFYDPVGALRDVVQNHLLQVIGLIAAESPSAADADSIRDKRLEVFRAMPPADPQRYVRGQYDGYLSVPGVRPGSQTETFAALRLDIDNWRWSGVPFFIRAGKELPVRATEVRIIFRPPPRMVFVSHTPHPNEFIVRIDPTPGADLVVEAKGPDPEGSLRRIDLSLIFAAELGDPPEPYERLLGDLLQGDGRLFVREDSEEETWRIVQPLLDAPPPVEPYARGSWGPAAAKTLLAGHPRWREPWLQKGTARPRSARPPF
jgi:glucose-6-phosphate 1-dehydrogenase